MPFLAHSSIIFATVLRAWLLALQSCQLWSSTSAQEHDDGNECHISPGSVLDPLAFIKCQDVFLLASS
jgi:hypothetical protein